MASSTDFLKEFLTQHKLSNRNVAQGDRIRQTRDNAQLCILLCADVGHGTHLLKQQHFVQELALEQILVI